MRPWPRAWSPVCNHGQVVRQSKRLNVYPIQPQPPSKRIVDDGTCPVRGQRWAFLRPIAFCVRVVKAAWEASCPQTRRHTIIWRFSPLPHAANNLLPFFRQIIATGQLELHAQEASFVTTRAVGQADREKRKGTLLCAPSILERANASVIYDDVEGAAVWAVTNIRDDHQRQTQ